MLQSPALSELSGIRHAFFTRDGGVSEGLYSTLNGGTGSNDVPAKVVENRARMAAILGVTGERFLTAYQIHSPDVVTIERPWPPQERPRADAIVTRTKGLGVGVTTADCGPVLFADGEAGVIGAAHAGWRGAFTGVLEATVAAMEACGASDKVIYPNHGLGVVQRIETRTIMGTTCGFYQLRMVSNDTTVLVPVENADNVGLRKAVGDSEIDRLFSLLGDGKIDTHQNWKGRFKDNSDRMRTGSLFDVVEVLKSLTYLARSKNLSFREKRMLDRAKFLVISEIAEVTHEDVPLVEQRVEERARASARRRIACLHARPRPRPPRSRRPPARRGSGRAPHRTRVVASTRRALRSFVSLHIASPARREARPAPRRPGLSHIMAAVSARPRSSVTPLRVLRRRRSHGRRASVGVALHPHRGPDRPAARLAVHVAERRSINSG